jgi:peptidoglycan hydrolase-like protein with peptidoglycan-binding domain
MRSTICLCLVLLGTAVSLRADEKVRQVQEALRRRNLYFGNVDGQDSSELTGALKRYQTRKGFQITGTADDETTSSLQINSLPLSAKQQSWPDTPVLKSDAARALSQAQQAVLEKQAEEITNASPEPIPPSESPARAQNLSPGRVSQFVAAYLHDAETADVSAQTNYYSFPLQYFDHGTVDAQFVAKDTSNYVRRWPDRKYTLVEPLTFFATGNEGETTVEFTIAFVLRSKARTTKCAASGRTRNVWTIRPEGDELKIVAISEQRLRE